MDGLDELDRILKLFLSHSHDPELHVRHIAALDKLCKGGSGFPVRDLPRITDILGCTLDLLLGQHAQVFLEPACKLIRCDLAPCANAVEHSGCCCQPPCCAGLQPD